MVVGKVVAVSCSEGLTDDQGHVRWDEVKSAHYCGAPYEDRFVAAYEVMQVAFPAGLPLPKGER